MKIIQITDCHLFASPDKVGYGDINPRLSLITVLSEVSLYHPDLLVVTGDISGDSTEQSYRLFIHLLNQAELTCDWMVIPGNHDHSNDLAKVFTQEQLQIDGSYVPPCVNWQLHFLNSQHQGTLGYVDDIALQNLSLEISLNNHLNHMIFVHHHPIDSGSWMDKHAFLNRQDLVQLVEQRSNVKAVVFGHVHQEMDVKQNSVRYLGCPSTCWQWQASDSFAVSDEMPGFRVINLGENGQIDTSVKRISRV